MLRRMITGDLMNSRIVIRELAEKDIYQITAIEQMVFNDPWSAQSFINAMKDDADTYLTAADADDNVFGYCGLWGIAGEGHITNVCVHPDYRSRGIGRMLIDEVIKRGRKSGLQSFTLEVRAGNMPAISLYKKFGFEEAGVRKNYYRKPTEDALIMWLY